MCRGERNQKALPVMEGRMVEMQEGIFIWPFEKVESDIEAMPCKSSTHPDSTVMDSRINTGPELVNNTIMNLKKLQKTKLR